MSLIKLYFSLRNAVLFNFSDNFKIVSTKLSALDSANDFTLINA